MKTKVALFINGWNGESADSFIDGLKGYFNEDEMDLFVFTSYSLPGDSQMTRDAGDAIYALPDYSIFDVAIIFSSGINSDDVVTEIIKKCKEADVPAILQGSDADGVSSVTVDNFVGMREICEHLIEKHDVKDVVFIAGPQDNEDSNNRLAAVKDVLKENGYKLEDENIFYANWEGSLIKTFLNERYGSGKAELPDAIMCANDIMAMFVLLFLEEMGYIIPEDTLVTGFDNLGDGKVCYPSLATVDQSYKEQGGECARLVKELFEDKKHVIKSIIPSAAIPGESCGCMNCNGETELRKKIGRVWWSERFTLDNLQWRELYFDMCVMSNEKFEDIQRSINEDFLLTTGEETEDFHVYVNPQYKNLGYLDVSNADEICNKFEPVMDVICAKTGNVVFTEPTFDTNKLFKGSDINKRRRIHIFKTLTIDDLVAGYMVMGYQKDAYKIRLCLELSGNVSRTLKKYQRNIDNYYKTIKIQEQANEFLQQTVEALAAAVDAKDSYTNGHSNRVAKYSRMIAKELGMTEKECNDIYLAGLLHDVGKIGIDDNIINKKGKLTDEEFAVIKLHPELGGQILSKIDLSPSLSVGARYHHERYDGNGYPEKLKGEYIPHIARIIAVADAYDAMTSTRSYRNIEPQMYVREELIKGIGTQFDPEYARVMLKLLDSDSEYTMRERQTEEYLGADLFYEFDKYKEKVSAGIRITECPVNIKIKYRSLKKGGQPTLLFYDSADARYYLDDNLVSVERDFVEFSSVDINGTAYTDYVRKTENSIMGNKNSETELNKDYIADIFLVKQDDHFLVRIKTEERTAEITFALYDAARYLYLAFTGECCTLEVLDVDISKDEVGSNYIPRIAEKITYIDGPEGDISNVQIDGWITSHSEILEFDNNINIDFHTMSLPSSRMIWHCPVVVLFTSDDGTMEGSNYRELTFVRLDGEVWSKDSKVINETQIFREDDFVNWSIWKQKNKAGVDCKLSVSRNNDVIELEVENSGLRTINKSIIPSDVSKMYLYFTGDQCAITNICVKK